MAPDRKGRSSTQQTANGTFGEWLRRAASRERPSVVHKAAAEHGHSIGVQSDLDDELICHSSSNVILLRTSGTPTAVAFSNLGM